MKMHAIVDEHPPVVELRSQISALEEELKEALERAAALRENYNAAVANSRVGEELPPLPPDEQQLRAHHARKVKMAREAADQAIAADADKLKADLLDRSVSLLAEIRSRLAEIDGLYSEFREVHAAHAHVGRLVDGRPRMMSQANSSFAVVLASARQGWNPLVDEVPAPDMLNRLDSRIESPADPVEP